jgi:beta-glucanase (GH16 family)
MKTMKIKKLACITLVLSLVASNTLAEETINQDTRLKSSDKNVATAPLFGAELYSHETVQFGKFIIRMKMVSEAGVVSSFFTYDNQSWQGEGRPWREIDFETIGSSPDILQTNLITGNLEKRTHSEKTSKVTAIDSFQTYTLEWTPNEIIWKVNENIVRRELATDSQQVREMADTPQTYRSNIWISEVIDWVGEFNEKQLPKYQVIDWIEFYQYKPNNSFTLKWRDDFNDFDNNRWGKGNWGFPSNMVTFTPENIQVIDGELVLALTRAKAGIDINHYKSSK